MLCVKEVKKYYNQGKENEVFALRGVNLTIQQGEMVAIMGPSGSGKSTLLNILGCMDTLTSGGYWINEIDVKEMGQNKLAEIRNKQIGFVLQDFGLLSDRSVFENIAIPLLLAKKKNSEIKKRVAEALDSLSMKDMETRRVNQLSGGQAQRVAIARAIVNDPSVILADEPTGSLDSATADEVIDIFRKLNDSGKTVIVVTHNQKIAEACDTLYVLKDGCICDL